MYYIIENRFGFSTFPYIETHNKKGDMKMVLYLILFIILIMTMYCVRINTGNFTAALSYDKSNAMKGILALVIVFHHLVLESNISFIGLEVFKYIAFPLVSVFFFFSGYGLVKSYYKNGGQIFLKQYAIKRMTRLLIPYIIVIIYYGLYKYFREPAAFNPGDFLTDVFLAREIGPLWYMTVILFVYALFGVCFKYLKAVTARRAILAATVVYIFSCIAFSAPSQWYSSIIGFYVGILYGMNEKKVTDSIHDRYFVKLFLLFFGFVILFGLRLVVSSRITDSEILHGPFRSAIDIVFILFLISLFEIIEIKKNAMLFIGKISYEIYLIHPFIIYSLAKKILDDEKYSLIAFLCSILLAYILNVINVRLSKNIINHFNRVE